MKSEDIYKAYYTSPIGVIEVTGTDTYISSVVFADKAEDRRDVPFVMQKCIRQLDEYFQGFRKDFSLELKLDGTDFQRKVWNELHSIKFGRTMSYIELAKKLSQPLAVRAVGNANSKNHFCIILPCHRVIGSSGQLIGYAGGLKRKQWLLDFEKKLTGNYQLSLFAESY